MPITEADIHYRYSGGSDNQVGANSTGGAISNHEIPEDVLNNLWADSGALESRDGSVRFRCFYIKNDNIDSLTYKEAAIWISQLTSSGDDEVDIGLGSTPVGTGDEQFLANDTVEPVGVIFSRPDSEAEALVIGDIPPGEHKAIWVRRTVQGGAQAHTANKYVTTVQGGTLA